MNVLFVCLGNICRSPAAEGIFKKMLKDEKIDHLVHVDSAGTSGLHSGEPADARMIDHAAERGYDLTSLSRQFDAPDDFENFDYIIAMDNDNYKNIKDLDYENYYSFKIKKMVEFCENIKIDHVPDPYFGGSESFEQVIDILEDACRGLIKKIKKEIE